MKSNPESILHTRRVICLIQADVNAVWYNQIVHRGVSKKKIPIGRK